MNPYCIGCVFISYGQTRDVQTRELVTLCYYPQESIWNGLEIKITGICLIIIFNVLVYNFSQTLLRTVVAYFMNAKSDERFFCFREALNLTQEIHNSAINFEEGYDVICFGLGKKKLCVFSLNKFDDLITTYTRDM